MWSGPTTFFTKTTAPPGESGQLGHLQFYNNSTSIATRQNLQAEALLFLVCLININSIYILLYPTSSQKILRQDLYTPETHNKPNAFLEHSMYNGSLWKCKIGFYNQPRRGQALNFAFFRWREYDKQTLDVLFKRDGMGGRWEERWFSKILGHLAINLNSLHLLFGLLFEQPVLAANWCLSLLAEPLPLALLLYLFHGLPAPT